MKWHVFGSSHGPTAEGSFPRLLRFFNWTALGGGRKGGRKGVRSQLSRFSLPGVLRSYCVPALPGNLSLFDMLPVDGTPPYVHTWIMLRSAIK